MGWRNWGWIVDLLGIFWFYMKVMINVDWRIEMMLNGALVRYLWLLRKISECEVNFRILGFQIRDFSKVGFKLLIGFDWRKLWLNWMYGIVYEPYGWLWLIVYLNGRLEMCKI